MIFDTMNSDSSINLEAVQPSQYDLGIKGALMHVYENEVNYNNIMKAVGISELKYYVENGGQELFLNESGALEGFKNKIVAFFKKVKEKILQIFKKFVMIINKFALSDKQFVKKYRPELNKVNLTDFEFQGYPEFKNIDAVSGTFKFDILESLANNVKYSEDKDASDLKKVEALKLSVNLTEIGKKITGSTTSDELTSMKDTLRGKLVGSTSLEESELREMLKDKLYGDKESLENISINEQLRFIEDTKSNIGAAEKAQKALTKTLDGVIKSLDKAIVSTSKVDEDQKVVSGAISVLNKIIEILKSGSNDATIIYGALVGALKDRNRQAKAICVKAISYKPKNEAASYGSYGEAGSLIDNVEIR